jgi:hypothetical protein
MALFPWLNREATQVVYDVIIAVLIFNILINLPNFKSLVTWPYSILTFVVILFLLVKRKWFVRKIAGSR